MINLIGDFFAVPIEKDWSDFEFNEAAPNVLMFCTKKDIRHIGLPKGKYTLLFLSNIATEKDTATVAEWISDATGRIYKSYLNGMYVFNNSMVSFRSLLASKSCVGNYAIIKKLKS